MNSPLSSAMLSFLKGFQYAIRGMRLVWSERNFRVQCGAALMVIALGIWLDISRPDWLVLIVIIGAVLSMEAMNTAIENVVNLVSPDYHPLAGKVKDIAAGAVLILSIGSVVVGVILFYPYLSEKLAE